MGNLLAVTARVASVVLAAAALAGCGQVSAVVSGAQRMIGDSGSAPAAAEATLAGPILHARIPARGLDADLALRDRDGDVATWTTGSGTTFTFREGVLIETRGLGSDLMSASAPAPAQLMQTGVPYRRSWYVTAANAGVEQRVYTCSTQSLGSERLNVAGRTETALHLQETCLRAAGKLTSDYWLDGAVIRKSRQWASPGAGYAEFEIVKD